MFHAAGWTYPWANTFAFATQASPLPTQWHFSKLRQICNTDHDAYGRLFHDLETSLEFRCNALLRSTHCPSTSFLFCVDLYLSILLDLYHQRSIGEETASADKCYHSWCGAHCPSHWRIGEEGDHPCSCVWIDVSMGYRVIV